MNKQITNLIGGVVILIAAAAGFYWLWNSSNAPQSQASVPSNLQAVEIESIKSKAQQILADRENLSSMPIPVPGQDQTGRDNPFADL